MKKIALVLLMTAACQGTDDPKPLTGQLYVLQSIEGEALPAAITPAGVATPIVVYADTLALHADGTGERRLLRSSADGSKILVPVGLTWVRSGTAVIIRLDSNCPPNADCFVPQYSGTEENGQITITTASATRVPLVYRYLYPPD